MPIELPKLRRDVPITEGDYPSLTFHQQMQEIIENIQTSFNELESFVTDLRIAQEQAEAAAREAARVNSYPAPTNVLTAADVGATVTITVAAHTRIYPIQGAYDVPDVTINGGTITDLSFSTTYWVYYDDETLENNSPTFVATSVINDAQVGAYPGRHLVGFITTPANGAGGTSGTGTRPPGLSTGDLL